MSEQPVTAAQADRPGGTPGLGPVPIVAGAGRIGLETLARAIRQVAPEAYLVAPRVLRRVIRHDLDPGWLSWSLPHREVYVVEASRALGLLDRDELGLAIDQDLPRTLILLPRPEPEMLIDRSEAEVLTAYWRRLFHARVHLELRRRVEAGRLSLEEVRARIDEIGQVEFDEARAVLRQERFLTQLRDLPSAYMEFVAVYLELRQFAPTLLPDFFPSLEDPVRIDLILANDLDIPGLLEGCRPPGAPELPPAEPIRREDDIDDEAVPDLSGAAGPTDEPPAELKGWRRRRYSALRVQARRAETQGNLVRAAICRQQAALLLPRPLWPASLREAQRDLQRLARRLGPPLELSRAEVQAWSRSLPPLLERAARGQWSPEARLLYDLQKIAVEHGREIYTVGPIAWLLSRGRRPLKRPLPYHRDVLRVNHLRSAQRRLTRVRLTDLERDGLVRLLRSALRQSQKLLRDRFRPRLLQTLEAQGWRPANLPESVARSKLVEELLDQIVDRGFLVMGDLRDAVSRNDLKLPDLTSDARASRNTDRLLATDHALAIALDGVYRRGEVYLRWLQRFSSLLFGTKPGRWFTLFVALPFGGSYVALKGYDYLMEELAHVVHGRPYRLFHWSSWFVLALFLEGVIHSALFRRGAARLFRRLARASRWLFLELPRGILNWPPIRALIASRAFVLLSRWVLRPALLAGTVFLVLLWGVRAQRQDAALMGGITYVLATLLLNSRPGRDLEEIVADRAVRTWQRFFQEIVPGLFRLIMEVFSRFLEAVELFLYTIDEWLRFRGDQGRLTLVVKAVLGVVWFAVTYLVRFAVNLVIEPQVNPIKHFPVVTVAHKVMLPLFLAVKSVLASPTLGLSGWMVWVIAGLVQFVPPGIVGFLVWEFKENWRLYRANRPKNLGPVIVGHHGETISRLLRPGFHSGTLPKLFARLRRAGRQPDRWSARRTARKAHEELRRVQHEVEHFVDRELIALLRASRALAGCRIGLGPVLPGTNRIQITLRNELRPADPLRIAFEEQSGWLVAGIRQPGWLGQLDDAEARVLRDALAGFYKRADVDLIRETIQTRLEDARSAFDLDERGLVVWPGGDYGREVVLPLVVEEGMDHAPVSSPAERLVPILDATSLMYDRVPLPWQAWVEVWDRDQAGEGHSGCPVPGFVFLPGRTEQQPGAEPRARLVSNTTESPET